MLPPLRPAGGGPDPDPAWPEGSDQRHDAGDPEEAFPVPFSVLDGFAMMLWTIIAQVLVVTGAIGVGAIDNDPNVDVEAVAGLGVQLVAQAVTLVGMTAYLSLRGVLTWRILGPIRPRPRLVAMGVGLGLVGLLLVLVVSQLIDSAFGPYEQPEQFTVQVSSNGGIVLVLAAISAVLLAPIIEETIFRSLLFQSIRRRIGLPGAMVISSLLFAAVHLEVVGSPPAMVGLVALALWLAGIFHQTGSLVVPITAHATYNAAVLIILQL